MKLYHPAFCEPILLTENAINVIIIENELLFYNVIKEIKYQARGMEGDFVLSDNNEPIDCKKHLEVISDVFSISCNDKKIISGINSRLIELMQNEEHYAQTVDAIGKISDYTAKIISELNCSVDFDSPIAVESIVKVLNIGFEENYDNLCEKIYDYVKLAFEFLKKDVFVFVNLKQYLCNTDLDKLYKFFQYEKLHLILFEGVKKSKLECENQLIIDKDLCII